MSRSSLEIPFAKMHGAGNDYIYINCLESAPENLAELARRVSDRHFGIGSDGLVAIFPSKKADFRMRMFNADGSEAEMCGNASRCIGKYVYEKHLTDKKEITLETLAGIRRLALHTDAEGKVESVTVDMGAPELRPKLVPAVSASEESMVSEPVAVGDIHYKITAVSMGNPHAVVFTDRISDRQVLEEGPCLECAEIFPAKANIEFARIVSPSEIEMRVWERGTGETLACGTGACATAVAAVLNGLTGRNVDVRLIGGTLHIDWDEKSGHVFMTGPAEFIAEGIFYF